MRDHTKAGGKFLRSGTCRIVPAIVRRDGEFRTNIYFGSIIIDDLINGGMPVERLVFDERSRAEPSWSISNIFVACVGMEILGTVKLKGNGTPREYQGGTDATGATIRSHERKDSAVGKNLTVWTWSETQL